MINVIRFTGLFFYFSGVKKWVLSIFTFLYLFVSSGVAMEIHYCMGKRAGTKFFSTSGDRCGLCGMKEKKKKKGCCHNEQAFYKLTADHMHAEKQAVLEQVAVILVTYFGYYQWLLPVQDTKGFVANHSPPLVRSGIMTCILHGVFRL